MGYDPTTKTLTTYVIMVGNKEKYNTLHDRHIGKVTWVSMKETEEDIRAEFRRLYIKYAWMEKWTYKREEMSDRLIEFEEIK